MTVTDAAPTLKSGRVVSIAGPVIDAEFPPGALPEINQALEFDVVVDGQTVAIKAEVAQQHADDLTGPSVGQPTVDLGRQSWAVGQAGQRIDQGQPPAQTGVIVALQALGPPARPAVGALIRVLQVRRSKLRHFACEALRSIGHRSPAVLSALMQVPPTAGSFAAKPSRTSVKGVMG